MFDSILTWLSDPTSWTGDSGILSRSIEHVIYTLVTLLIAALIAIPIGLWVGHTGRGSWVVQFANSMRALPSLGLLFLAVLVLGPRIRGDLAFLIPSILVLVVLAIPPILAGTYSGVDGVDPAARDAAKGMGMSGSEVLWKVELPAALPLIFSGLRSAALQVVATATIAATVSIGGLGRFLIDGLAVRNYGVMAGGALLIGVLALIVDALFGLIQRYAVSPGLKAPAGAH